MATTLFFVQDRIGINRQNSGTEMSGLQITKIGKNLRKTNIDEIPLFINC